ncbi:MAG: Uma2 family endonuclease [Roseiflexaceae bacterium]
MDGPADLVIEITMLGHERDETELRRRIYAAAGIPEYWIVDPTAQTMQFFRHVDGAYQEQPLAPDGRYQPAHIPGLTCVPARPEGVNSFETDRAGQFRYEPVGHGAGGQRLRVADSPPGIKGPLRRLRPLTPERSSARELLSPVPQPTFAAAGAAG